MTSALLPSFSIVIPTYNRPDQLAVCLAALSALDYPADRFEVIAVDDGGSVSLAPIIAPFRDRLAVQVIRQANTGPGIARNRGAAAAGGEFIAFTDDDCRPHPAWLRELGRVLADHPDALVGGKTINLLTDNLYSSTSQLIMDVVYRHYNADPNNAGFFATNNMALSREKLLALGGFDARFRYAASEDRELCDHWRWRGGVLRCVETALIYHAHPLTLRSYLRQHFRYGQGAYEFHQTRARRGSGTLAREMSFHADVDNWLLRPIREARGWRRKLQTFVLLGAWQAINAAGYGCDWLRGAGLGRG